MVTVNRFHRLILVLLVISFACATVGALDLTGTQALGAGNNTSRTLLVGLAFCLLVFLLVWKSFQWLDTLNKRGCLVVSLAAMLLTAALLALVSFSARMSQYVDSIDVLDTAFYLRKNAEVTEDLLQIKYVGSFGNNYPVILFESFLIKILTNLGVQDCEMFLDHMNVAVLLAAVILAWLIVKETRGIKAAAKTAVFCLFNPYFYLLVNWTYSMTYSLPVMMGILYIALRLKRTERPAGGILLALAEGLLAGIGWLIRVTTVFPLIAAGLVWLPAVIRRGISRRRIIQVLCFLFALILVLVLVNIQVDRRFGKIRHLNLPLSFWLMLGSHGDGTWYEADLDAVMSLENLSDRSGFAFEQAWKNWSGAGIGGLLNLWYRKIKVNWANGGFFFWPPAVSEGNSLSEYYTGCGAKNQVTKLYSQAFRLLLIVLFLAACVVAVCRKKVPEIVLIMIITVFGGVVFHSVWEVSTRYSIPFLLPMLVAAGYGISTVQEKTDGIIRLNRLHKRALGFATAGFLIIACAVLNSAMREKASPHFYSVFSTENARFCAEIEPRDFQRLEQDFYANKPFNTLFFRAALPENKDRNECSGYELSILDDAGKELRTVSLSPDLVGNKGIKATFDPVYGSGHYAVRLLKTEPEKESIRFYTHYTYSLDAYRGSLATNLRETYPDDLMMDVYEERETAIFTKADRIILISFILVAGILSALVPVRKKHGSGGDKPA